MTRQPNILFVMADQMSALATPVYGHPIVHAPNMSALAEGGVVFRNAYCNSPLCGPSRLSMMSGRLPSAIGAYDNAVEFPASIPTFAHYLRLLRYRTCLSGKMHFAGPDQLHGYEERLTTDIYPSDFSWTPNWSDPGATLGFQADFAKVVETGQCERSLQIDYDDEVEYQAIRWIYDRARDESKEPFMLTVSFTSPHDPYDAQPEFWNLYEDDRIDLPSVGCQPDNELDPHSRRILSHYSIDKVDLSASQIRRARHGYYSSISYIDAKLGALRRALERSGQLDDTIVVFASDHGDMMGERGLWYKKCFFEWALRVPLIMSGPGLSRHDVHAPVSLLDLLPTFVEIAGGTDADILQKDGESLWPAALGNQMTVRTVAAEYLAEGVLEPVFMLRDARYKFLFSAGDPAVLFDLLHDPAELTNLARSGDFSTVLATFEAEAAGRWHADAIKAAVIADQNNRRVVRDAHAQGRRCAWDYQPITDASQQWVRAGAADVEAKAHLPVRSAGSGDIRNKAS
ncbi:MAG: choline-sulfatase [Mesorhizobium sp.]|uniref:choline-sulfatase n=1 Tax=Mesorhizobium sp. TaxID=1871066 RepID=UPI00121D10B3|nr:choline-sulfatase [Mesorhizobium sp.]TIQ17698.1 MAG: choline-sulfatase [Mesorhizobium sp.]